MRSLAKLYRTTSCPRYLESAIEEQREWMGCETSEIGNTFQHLERWILFRSAQYVYNAALDHHDLISGRTHVLEILDGVTAAFQVATLMANQGYLSGAVRLTFDFYGVDGRRLSWPQDSTGYSDAVSANEWSDEERIHVTKTVQSESLSDKGREFALEAALEIYAGFRWMNPNIPALRQQQRQSFG